MIAPDFAQSLLREYGSPLYAYDLDEVDRRPRSLLAVLPPNATLFYSLKANPLPALVETLTSRSSAPTTTRSSRRSWPVSPA